MVAVNHESRAHALLSASKSERWLECPPSARLEEKFEESQTSVYAAEGTLAHEFGQINIQLGAQHIDQKTFNAEIKKLRKHKLYTEEMEPEVQKYVDYVLETFRAILRDCPGAVLLVEERLDFSHLVEAGFGTGDICIIADGVLWVIDLKYGKGVRVDANDNSQLKLYGSGALRKFELMYDIETVKLVIVQPRLDHIDEWEISADDLVSWGEDVVKPTAIIAYSGGGVQKAGDHCKFCKVKAMCRAMADKNIELAQHEFRDPHLLSDKELIGIFKQTPMLVDWANAISDYVLAEAIKGKEWKGYKVVEGRSNRKWSDDAEVVKVLQGNNIKGFLNAKLKGVAEIEKLVQPLWFSNALAKFVLKPPGAPTLALESDKRPALTGIESAKKDFQ